MRDPFDSKSEPVLGAGDDERKGPRPIWDDRPPDAPRPRPWKKPLVERVLPAEPATEPARKIGFDPAKK